MYYSIEQGNQTQLILIPDKDEDWIELTKRNYSWEKYDEFDNRLDEYMEHLFDVLPELGHAAEDDDEFWIQLSRGQKIFYTYLVFEGSVENGGIFQFFWERPEHIYAFDEVIEILDVQPLKDDYISFVDHYETKAKELEALQDSINYNNKKWEEQYNQAYDKGLDLFGEEHEIGEYFMDPEFKKTFHKAMSDYIETHLEEFIKVRSSEIL